MSPQSADTSQAPPEVLRWYTRALKIPQLIGKLPSGERIKGGPYRPVQLISGLVVLVIGVWTMSWWGSFTGTGILGTGLRILIVVALAVITALLAKNVPLGMISPTVYLGGVGRQLGRSSGYRLNGTRYRPKRPTRHTLRADVGRRAVVPAATAQEQPAVRDTPAPPATDPPATEAPAATSRPAGRTPEALLAELLRSSCV